MYHIEKLRLALENEKGVRIGQTSVVSKKVHTLESKRPEIINIISNSDAGKVFYNRANKDEIIHIDLFHEVAICDVKKLAKKLIDVLNISPAKDLLDFIDIQTADGGGRLTGKLSYGKTETLKKNHLNHVHIACLMSDNMLEYIFLLVDKIEEGLLEQNIELRKVKKILHKKGKVPMDLSDYATDSDSKLKSNNNEVDNFMRTESLRLIDGFGSVEEVVQILDLLKDNKIKSNKANSGLCDLLRYLNKREFVKNKNHKYELTDRGRELRKYIRQNQRELEVVLKKLIRSFAKNNVNNKVSAIKPKYQKPFKNDKGVTCLEEQDINDRIGEIDIVETSKKALIRCHKEKSDFHIGEEDFVSVKRILRSKRDICLIIDASASMSGQRLRNAKYLARHLILNTGGKVSVLGFQEKEVVPYVPFTRNFNLLDKGLCSMVSRGLTPLALALYKGLLYIKNFNYIKNPLIILITDGIPTVSCWTSDPINDAVRAASFISKNKVEFYCIGLQPSRNCLSKIVQAANGRLYILDELEKEKLIGIASNFSGGSLKSI